MSFTQGQLLTAAALNNAINSCYPAGNVSAYSGTLLNQTSSAAWQSMLGISSLSGLGQPNGIATLDGTGHLMSTQVPTTLSGNFSVKGPLPWIDVVAYGAVGDGVTDSTTAINNALAALPSTGGVVYFPPGTYNVSGTLSITTSNTALFGGGPGVSVIQSTSATADVISFGGGSAYTNMFVRYLSVGTNATRTAGNAIKFNNVTGGGVQGVGITSPFTGIYLTGSSYIFISDTSVSNPVATGQGVIVNTGNNYYFDRLAVFTASTQCTYGMNFQACDSAFIDNCHFVQTGYGIYANPASAVTVQKVTIANSAATSCTNDGFVITPQSGGFAYNIRLEGVRAASNTGNGITLSGAGTTKSVNIVGTRVVDNNGHGISLTQGTYVMIDCCHIGGNSAASSGTNSGINVAANVNSFDIRNCRCGLSPASGSATQKYGINVATGSSNHYTIIGNDVNDNVTQGLNDGGSGTDKQLISNLPATNETQATIGGTLTLSNYGAGVLQTNVSGVVSAVAGGSVNANTRQTVMVGPVTAAGLPNFLPATAASLTLTTQNIASGANNFVATAANGYNSVGTNDAVGAATSNFSWSSLTANSTLYLYVTISGSTLTAGFTSLVPIYQFGGSISTTNGQFTFDYSQMIGYLGNGSSAPQTNLVMVGECVTGASTVTSTKAYAYRGWYDSGLTATLPGTSTQKSFNHNLGVLPNGRPQIYLKCTTADNGYASGDFITDPSTDSLGGTGVDNGQAPFPVRQDRLTCSFTTGSGQAFVLPPKAGGNAPALTAANWSYGIRVSRGWHD